ncbi:MAG: sensor histidine kinase [Anaerolineae bacterium]|nr:sensor histidine kinase [Anaerolineae bacterium]
MTEKRGFWTQLMQRLWRFAGGVSIRVKVLGIVVGVIILLGVSVTLQMRAALSTTLHSELDTEGQALADRMAQQVRPLLAIGNIDGVVSLMQEQQEHYANDTHNTKIAYIILTDSEGRLVASISNERQDEELHVVNSTVSTTQGQLQIGLTQDNLQEIVNTVTWRLVSTTLIMIALGFGASFFLTWILTRPILDLVSATESVAQGNFSRRVPRWADDEIGDLADAFNNMTEALAQAEREQVEREQLRSQYISGVIVAQEGERQRIARELHDSTSQSLTSLLVGLQNLKQTQDPDEMIERIDELRHVIGETLDDVRNMAWQLRPSALDDLGLVSALQRFISDYQQRYGIQVDFAMKGLNGRLPLEMETSIYRIIQEGLTNIARYAQSETASVLIDQRQQKIRLIIEDNGIGFDPDTVMNKRSLGLQGIRERAALFGGTLTIESQAGHGASLFVEIPLEGDVVHANSA